MAEPGRPEASILRQVAVREQPLVDMSVDSSGFPSAESALYRPCRVVPVSCGPRSMPKDRAMSVPRNRPCCHSHSSSVTSRKAVLISSCCDDLSPPIKSRLIPRHAGSTRDTRVCSRSSIRPSHRRTLGLDRGCPCQGAELGYRCEHVPVDLAGVRTIRLLETPNRRAGRRCLQ
jgi:hypothetical protein